MELRTLGQSDLKITPIGIGGHFARGGIAALLKNPAVTGAIVGVRSTRQVTSIARAGDVKLSADDMLEIEQGLARKAA
jgi:aryl-alcohol dehydrogenase-like predicted oxidoreductase